MVFASSGFSPLSPWQAWSQLRPRSWSCAAATLPSRAGDSVWPVSPSVPVSAVTSASAVALRHRSLAKRNGAFAVRYCLRLRVTRSIVNHCAIGTPVPSITALASNQCTIPFGRKWHSEKRKCRQQPARQVLACNSRDAKRNPLPARAGSLFEPTASPQLFVCRHHPALASRRFRLAGQFLFLSSAR